MLNSKIASFVALGVAFCAAGCGDDGAATAPADTSGGVSSLTEECDADCRAAAALTPAVMVAVNVQMTDDSVLYVGAYPALPEGELDTSQMLEVGGSASAAAFNGSVYVWEGELGQYTRFSVDASLGLVRELSVSFMNLGGTGPSMTSFVSPTQAYTLTTENQQIIAWNPSDMTVSGSISTEALVDPDYPRVEYGEPAIFGDYVAWPILWSDYDAFRFKPEVGVALVRIGSSEPAMVVRDARCGAGWSLYTNAAGDLYATGNGYFGFAHFYGEEASTYPNDCVLRMRAGTTEFDPDYRVDLNAATGSPAVFHTWHVSDDTLLAAVWDPQMDPSSLPTSDDYWNAPLLRTLVDLNSGTSTLVEGIPPSAVWSTVNYRLDDTLYVPESDGSLELETVTSTLYRVTGAGAERAFSVAGDLWAIGRIR
jgi:uncharacterized protein DUF4374